MAKRSLLWDQGSETEICFGIQARDVSLKIGQPDASMPTPANHLDSRIDTSCRLSATLFFLAGYRHIFLKEIESRKLNQKNKSNESVYICKQCPTCTGAAGGTGAACGKDAASCGIALRDLRQRSVLESKLVEKSTIGTRDVSLKIGQPDASMPTPFSKSS